VSLAEVGRDDLQLVGGKGANLGEIIRSGLPVPGGFCVTTDAYSLVAEQAGLQRIVTEVHDTDPEDAKRLESLAASARQAILDAPVPEAVEASIRSAYAELSPSGPEIAVAVRSSATAEDLGEASFAGQQETYLNVVGATAVVDSVRSCWASLWTYRAVTYRADRRVDQRHLLLSAVVQEMVPAAVSGVLFTANPITGRRAETVLDAVPGLGEALVSGRVNPDHFVVDRATGVIRQRKLGERQTPRTACLSDDEVARLVQLGDRVEALYEWPQDIEWALDQQRSPWVLQTRPITTLFPLPQPSSGDGLRVYLN
jgi:pyruvate,water dikinase